MRGTSSQQQRVVDGTSFRVWDLWAVGGCLSTVISQVLSRYKAETGLHSTGLDSLRRKVATSSWPKRCSEEKHRYKRQGTRQIPLTGLRY